MSRLITSVVISAASCLVLISCAGSKEQVRRETARTEYLVPSRGAVNGYADGLSTAVVVYAPTADEAASVVICSGGPDRALVIMDVPDGVNDDEGRELVPGRCVDFRYYYSGGMRYPFVISVESGRASFTASVAVEGATTDETPAKSSHRRGIGATVLGSTIQRDRVVILLDAGSKDGVRTGMKGTLSSGRPFTVISVDSTRCQAVVTGLNVRIPDGAGATIIPQGR